MCSPRLKNLLKLFKIYMALSLVFSINAVCVKTKQKHGSIKHHDHFKPNNSIISLRIWYNNMSSFLFQNTESANFEGYASMLTSSNTDYCSHNCWESFGHDSLHTNPLSLHSSWYWETFVQSSCQIAQFLRSKNRQKGDQFFYKMSDFCEICNPHFSYHTCITALALVNVCLIFDLQKHVNWLFTFLKIFICLKFFYQ